MRSLSGWIASAAVIAMFAPSGASAQQQQKSQEELTELFEKKIASDWLKNAKWHLDLEAAKTAAAESGKPIFAYFTRSYSP